MSSTLKSRADGLLDPSLPEIPGHTLVRTAEENETDELSFQDIHGDMPWWEKALIGVGRGAMDLGQGAKQSYLMATDPAAAEQYTQGVNEDVRIFEEGLGEENPILSLVSRIAGNALPMAAAAPAGVLGAAGIGALEGAAQFTPEAEWGDKGINAGLGAGFGGGTQAALNTLFRFGKPATQAAKDAVVSAGDTGVKLRPQDISDNRFTNLIGTLGEAGVGSRMGVAPGAEAAARDLVGQTTGGTDTLLGSARRSIDANKTQQTKLYGELQGAMEATAREGVGNVQFNPKLIQQGAQDLIDQQMSSGLPNMKVVKQLERIKEAVPEGNSFESWRKFRTQLSNQMVKWNRDGIDAGPLKQIYGGVSENLRATAAASGDDAARLFDEANALTSQIHELRMSQVGKLVDKGEGTRLETMLRGGGDIKDSPEAAKRLFDALDEPGRENARHMMLNGALEGALDQKGVFIPSKFSTNLSKLRKRSEVFFGDSSDMVDQIKGIENLMAHVKDPDQAGILAKFFIPGGIAGVGGSIGGILGGPEAATMGATAGLAAAETLLPWMTRHRSMNAMMKALMQEEVGSNLSRSLVDEMFAIASGSAAGAATQPQAPMQIEIRQ